MFSNLLDIDREVLSSIAIGYDTLENQWIAEI
jgi:hypothetical protein